MLKTLWDSVVMRVSTLLFLGFIVSGALSAAEESAGAAEELSMADASEAAEGLIKRLEALETFQAQFAQFILDKSGSIQQTSGTLKAMKPGFFYWHTDPPLEQVIVSDGERVKVFDPDLEQVTIQRMQSTGQTPAALLSGDGTEIKTNYRVSLTQKDDYFFYVLEPLNEDSLFDSLQLKFVDETLVEMRLRDGLGQKTTLSFINIKSNEKLTAKDFELSLPADVDIIEEN